jgi:uncharacterized membrane protein
MEYGYPALVMAAGIFCAVVAGFFLAFSGCVMGALSKGPAVEAISAMQAINVVVINPVIMTFLFGTAALGVALIGLAVTRTTTTAGPWVITGGVIYLVGVVVTTVAVNVPLNN